MANATAVAAYVHARQVCGQDVTFKRVTGNAPSASTATATVRAVVKDYVPSTPRDLGSFAREGGVSQHMRTIIVLESALNTAGFPIPVKKNDRVIVKGETWNVVEADLNSRDYGGAYVLKAENI